MSLSPAGDVLAVSGTSNIASSDDDDESTWAVQLLSLDGQSMGVFEASNPEDNSGAFSVAFGDDLSVIVAGSTGVGAGYLTPLLFSSRPNRSLLTKICLNR